jgi:transposase
MGAAYSHDLRERVMAAVDGGLGVYSAAPMFRVSVSSMYKALGRRRATGAVTAHKSGGGPKPKLAAYDEALRAQVAQKADITLVELQAWLANDRAVKVSVGCVGAGPSSWVDAQKKSQRAAEQDRPDLAQARQQWRAQQAEWRAHNLVFVDETGASTKMTRLDRRCPCGERLVSPVPWGHWKTTTFIGAQRAERSRRALRLRRADQRREVPRLGRAVPRSRTQARRYRGVGQSVEPQGRRRQNGHRKRQSPSAVPAALQPRSQPDRAGVRQAEALLRKAAPRTFDALINAIASALEAFTPDECANYLANSGYPHQ